MYKVLFFFCTLICMFSCKSGPDGEKKPLISYKDHELYKEELEKIVPEGLVAEDSIAYCNEYMENWINDALLYEIARNNISNDDEIRRLVEHYRRSLIVYQYQQQLMNEKVLPDITAEEIEDYYNRFSENFILKENIIAGLYVKVPIGAPSIDKLRQWYRDSTATAIEKIEKYSIQNAIDYNYFYDQWLPLEDLLDKVPYKVNNEIAFLHSHNCLEVRDSSFNYFLYIHKYKQVGDKAPFTYAYNTIMETLYNQKKMTFMQEFLKELRLEENDNIIINTEPKN